MLTRSPMNRTGVLRVASHDLAARPVKGPKPKTCQSCREKFTPAHTGAKVCSPDCAAALVALVNAKTARKKAKAVRAADKVALAKFKTRSDWIKSAQVAFNAFIRERDKDQPCISSGRPLQAGAIGGGFDAGHYRSIGSAPHLRYDERNVHGQSKQDNRYLAGNAVDYRIGLIKRRGLAEVEELEADNEPRKHSIADLMALESTYKLKLKELQA